MSSISNQYNKFAMNYSQLASEGNAESKFCYYSQFDIPLENKKVLDMGCGEGVDFKFYFQRKADVYGIDESVEMMKIAQKNFPQAHLKITQFNKVPCKDEFFDVVCSKWAYQTFVNIESIYREVYRILKPGGHFIYLATHPFRQFMEKKKSKKNYFLCERVESRFFKEKITAIEPSHTFNEYFSPFFLQHFEVLSYEEQLDSAAEVIDDCTYPSFFLIKSKKKVRE